MSNSSKSENPKRPVTPSTPPTPPRTVSPGYPYAYLNNSPSSGGNCYQNYNNYNHGYRNNGYPYPPQYPPSPNSQMPGPSGYNYYPQVPPNQYAYYGNNNPSISAPMMSQSPVPNGYNGHNQYHNQNFQPNNRPPFNKGHHQPNQRYQGNNNRYNNRNNNQSQNGNPNSNNKNSNKKSAIDKRDLPENNKFYCEVCDRGFKTDDKYQEHCATHETCGVNGCTFTAASKLVEIHYRNFHATGIDKKVSSLKTAEDLQKYIDERKKNFPSKTNMDKKVGFEKEKSSRGISLNTQEFGKIKHNKRHNQNFKNGQRVDDRSPDPDSEESVNPSTSVENRQGVNRNLHMTNDSKNSLKNKKKKGNKKNLYQQKMQVLKTRYNKPTLLQRLLADEIRHERNIILQCVRYVVQNNFFDKK